MIMQNLDDAKKWNDIAALSSGEIAALIDRLQAAESFAETEIPLLVKKNDALIANERRLIDENCRLQSKLADMENKVHPEKNIPGQPVNCSNDREALDYLMEAFDNEINICNVCGDESSTHLMDSAIYLREYLAKPTPAQQSSTDNPKTYESVVQVCPERDIAIGNGFPTPSLKDIGHRGATAFGHRFKDAMPEKNGEEIYLSEMSDVNKFYERSRRVTDLKLDDEITEESSDGNKQE